MPGIVTAPRGSFAPMLALPARSLPVGEGWVYEPKWDGFRCLAYAEDGEVDLRSRHGKPLAACFPEVVDALAALPEGFALDGEVLAGPGGEPEFGALMARLHPAAAHAERLRAQTPAWYVAFDLLVAGGENVSALPFAERRARLVALLDGADVVVTPSTTDPEVASRWLTEPVGGALDGVIAKRAEMPYQPGKRVMVKVKRERTADCVVAGMRVAEGPAVSSLLLGLWSGESLVHAGVVHAFGRPERVRLVEELAPFVVPLAGHPWEDGLPAENARWLPGPVPDWVPLRPVLVAEVAYSQADGARFRHPARLVRWRPDRVAASCTVDQLA